MKGFDNSGDSAAGAEIAYDFGPYGIAGFHDVVENLVDDVLLEDAEIAEGEEIFLEGFEFEAGLAGHVADGDATEVGQAGLGADRGELGIVDEDLVGLELIAPGFDGRKFDVEAGFCVVVCVAGGFVFGFVLFGHASILSLGYERSDDARSGRDFFLEGTVDDGILKIKMAAMRSSSRPLVSLKLRRLVAAPESWTVEIGRAHV